MAVFNNILAGASGATGAAGYEIERSLRFNEDDSAYLNRTPASAGNRMTWTWSGWVKISEPGSFNRFFTSGNGTTDSTFLGFLIRNDGVFTLEGGSTIYRRTSSVFRDVSAWYHLVVAFDTTQATGDDRIKIYINGVQLTDFATSNNPSPNSDHPINNNIVHDIGANHYGGGLNFNSDFYLADVHFIDGQALAPTDFGEYDANGVWQPKEYEGGYGLVSVADATGALPIYNTSDTYGTVKGTGTRTDANASNLVLALPMDGTNGGTTFTDESATIKGSGSAKTITASNIVTSTTLSKYYGSSAYSDTNYNSLTVSTSADFSFGTGDFTIECWAYPISITSYGHIFQTAGSNTTGFLGFGLTPIGTAFCDTYTGSSRPKAETAGVKTNSWNHIAAVRNGNDWTVYVNGVAGSSTTITQSLTSGTPRLFSNADEFVNGRFNGYINDFRVYNGIAKYTSDFTVPERTNSFHLPFSDNSTAAALGTDTSGAGNDWTANNLSVASGAGNDSLVDSPTNGTQTDTGVGNEVVGNYCTWNPLANTAGALSNGNLDLGNSTPDTRCNSTISVSSGKWYYEITLNTLGTNSSAGIGQNQITNAWPGNDALSYSFELDNARTANNGSLVSYGSALAAGDIFMCAFDLDNNKIFFGKNGTWFNSSDPAAGTNAAYTLSAGSYCPIGRPYGGGSFSLNTGQRAFAYTAPSGYKALCTTNLPDPTIADGSTYFDTKLYTGNGSTQTISGLNFSPDLVWIKNRQVSGRYHTLVDIVRGIGNTLYSNLTSAEYPDNAYSSFNSDGFTISTSDAKYNASSQTYVAWAWDGGSSTVSNTDGSITSQVRANPSAGFSVVTWTGNGQSNATVGHGQGVAPAFIVTVSRDGGSNWNIYHKSLATDNCLFFTTSAAVNVATSFGGGGIGPGTSTTLNFTQGTSNVDNANANGVRYLAYVWSEVDGYSSFGSYTGNGSADGPFVYTGFRPRWILYKNSSIVSDWRIYDAVRLGYNTVDTPLYPNLSIAENTTTHPVDILSNGFKVRGSAGGMNESGNTIVFGAFAENPFKTARAR